MNVARKNPNYRIRPLKGPMTLVLTHLRGKDSHNTRVCRKMWELTHSEKTLFGHRLSLLENRLDPLQGVPMRRGEDDKVFSSTGAVFDTTLPTGWEGSGSLFVTAAQRGFMDKGRRVFVHGGGNAAFCLFKTWRSILELKMGQEGERLQSIIPLPLLYFSKAYRPDYPNEQNIFLDYLVNHCRQRGFVVTVDGKKKASAGEGDHAIELHWYTTVTGMFKSPFFPEFNDPKHLAHALEHFRHI
jgi:hypothetical protein